MITLLKRQAINRAISPQSLKWMQTHKQAACPDCHPFTPASSLVQFHAWCPRCLRVWAYFHDPAPKSAPGRWWHTSPPLSSTSAS